MPGGGPDGIGGFFPPPLVGLLFEGFDAPTTVPAWAYQEGNTFFFLTFQIKILLPLSCDRSFFAPSGTFLSLFPLLI